MAGDARRPPDRPSDRQRRPGLRARAPIEVHPDFPALRVGSHRELVVRQPEIVRRLHAHPELALMLFINPVLAFRDFGIELSPEMADHVLRSLQHPPRLRARRDELEASLTRALGTPPRPEDPAWLARTLFGQLQLPALDTSGHAPVYRSPLPPDAIERLEKVRPRFRNQRGDRPRRLGGMVVRLKEWHPSARRLDLDATIPELPWAAAAPASLTLEELYFYKDMSPVARELLELGIIRRRAFPVQSGDSYRRIKRGEKASAFRGWLTALRFPALREPPAEGEGEGPR
jgi:hypothetical protein